MIKSSYLTYLLSLIKTKSYAEEVIKKIDELRESLYNKRIDLDKKMSELFSFELKEKIKAYSWQEQVNLSDPESFAKFLSSLREFIRDMPVVTLYIAYELDDDLVREISDWFISNFGKNVLLDLVYEPSVIAGARIVFDEEVKDFSLRKRLEERYKEEDWKKFVQEARQG